jgi:hypothetical protein
VVKNHLYEPEGVAAFDFLAHQGFENLVIDRVKIFFDVALRNVWTGAREILRAFDQPDAALYRRGWNTDPG